MGASTSKLGKTLRRVFEGQFFPHPKGENGEPPRVPYFKKTTGKGHIVLNTPLDKWGKPYPGGTDGSSYTLPNTSGDQNAWKIAASQLANRGVCPDLLSTCFLQLGDEIDRDYSITEEHISAANLPEPGSLVQPRPTAWNIVHQSAQSSWNKLHPFWDEPLIMVVEWYYSLDGSLVLKGHYIDRETGRHTSGVYHIVANHQDWDFDLVSGSPQQTKRPPAPIIVQAPDPKANEEALAEQKEALKSAVLEKLSEAIEETFGD